jgi:hypothetical protein
MGFLSPPPAAPAEDFLLALAADGLALAGFAFDLGMVMKMRKTKGGEKKNKQTKEDCNGGSLRIPLFERKIYAGFFASKLTLLGIKRRQFALASHDFNR